MDPKKILQFLSDRAKQVQSVFAPQAQAQTPAPKKSFDESMKEKGYTAGADGVYRPQGAAPQTPTATPMAQAMEDRSNPTQTQMDPSEIEKKIREGYKKYAGKMGVPEVPIEKNIPQMVEAVKKYPIFQKYPYLIPAVSIVETQGGKNYTLNNNPLSWAARVQKEGGYSPQSSDQSIGDMITAVGGDPNRGAGYDPETARTRMSTAAIYNKFRDTGDLQEFTDRYEPPNNNPHYHQDVQWLMDQFNNNGNF